MMGIARSSVICFVIDTTGSMSEDIKEARSIVYQIIDSKKGTQDEPSEYILVPFNDPGMNLSTLLIMFRKPLVVLDNAIECYICNAWQYSCNTSCIMCMIL